MIFQSTRGKQCVSLDEALVRGLAEDGCLFLPQELPQFSADDFASSESAAETAQILLRPFFTESALAPDLAEITSETFRFPLPVSKLPATEGYAAIL